MGKIRKVEFSADGARLLVLSRLYTRRGQEEDLVEIIDPNDKQRPLATKKIPVEERRTARETFKRGIRLARLSPDGSRVLYLLGDDFGMRNKGWIVDFGERKPILRPSQDPVAYLWHLDGREERLVGHTNDIATASFARQGRQVVTAGIDGTVRVQDVEAGEEMVGVLRGPPAGIAIARFSPDGRHIVTARGYPPENKAWDDKDKWEARETASARVWSSSTWREVARLRRMPTLDATTRHYFLRAVEQACISPDGSRVLTLSNDSAGTRQRGKGKAEPVPFTPLRIHDSASGKELVAPTGLQEQFQAASFSPNGRFFLAVAKGPVQQTVATDTGARSTFRFSSDMSRKEPTILIFEAASGKLLRRIGPREVTMEPVWSADSQRLFVFNIHEGDGQILDVATGEQVGVLERGSASAGLLDPTGERLVGYVNVHNPQAGFGSVWDARTGRKTASLEGHTEEVYQAVFDATGERIVTASRDGTARVWDAASGETLLVLRGHAGPVWCCAIDAGGKWIATGGDDGTTRLWDARSGEEWMTLPAVGGPVLAVSFHPEGERVLTASRDGAARLWPVDPLPGARQRRPRELTDAEKLHYDVRPLAP
jgi:WD40 repeat protein